MSHIHRHEDEDGNLVDVTYYCSDWCHRDHCLRTGLAYEGWDGCHEVESDQQCANCEANINGLESSNA